MSTRRTLLRQRQVHAGRPDGVVPASGLAFDDPNEPTAPAHARRPGRRQTAEGPARRHRDAHASPRSQAASARPASIAHASSAARHATTSCAAQAAAARAGRAPDLPAEDPRARPADEADAGRAPVRRIAADLLLHGRGRVDFRELVRDLAAHFRTRIEMRQIGVRDEARMLGGYGSCGRPLCCTTWLQSFEPVSIKMAKQQHLSLNPSKLSGMCGRLKCCLRYELPNGKGVKHGGCADEGGCANPDRRCGTCGAERWLRVVRARRLRIAADEGASAHRHHRRRSRRHRPGDRGTRPPRIRACSTSASRCSTARCATTRCAPSRADSVRPPPAAPPTTPSSRAVEDARAGRVARDRDRADQQGSVRRRRAAVEGPHRSARAPHRRDPGGDDVPLRRLRVVLATVHIPLAEVPRAAHARPARGRRSTLTAARAAALRLPARRGSRRRPQSARRRARADRRPKTTRSCGRRSTACRARGIDVSGPLPGDTRLRARHARRVRRGHRLLPRPGPDPRQAGWRSAAPST